MMKCTDNRFTILLAALAVLALASPTMAWDIKDTGDDYSKAASYYGYSEEWGYGWASTGISSSGGDGIYSLKCNVYCDPGSLGWYEPDTGTQSSDGWRKKTLKHQFCDPRNCSVTFEIDGSVEITGYMCADNQMVTPLGNVYYYGWAKEILSGLASGTAQTKASYSGEECDSQLTVGAGPINVSTPIDFENDEANLNGNDTVSSGDTVTGEGQDFIKLRGTVYSHAKTWDGGQEADGTTSTELQTFTLTINE